MLGQTRRGLQIASLWRESRRAPCAPISRSHWERSLREPTAFYRDCTRAFFRDLPAEYRAHRTYFSQAGRGLGEHAFHVMWKQLLDEFKPARFLEIGVFRGQVISLVALWAKLNARQCEVWGISPFSPAGDSVSKYSTCVDYYQDTLQNFAAFGLSPPQLQRGYSTQEACVKLIQSHPWDIIYVDGNHDYEVVKADWENCSRSVRPGGVIVLDDSGLTTAYQPPVFATGGHPGPSRMAREIDRTQFREILQVGHNRAFQKL